MRLRVKRSKKSGILLPLFSLPSKYGIGSLGAEAYSFVDFLKNAGQSYWQMLPLCPVGKADSPYSSASAFAGEILYIDIDFLVADGLIKKDEIKTEFFPERVDYKSCREFKIPLLKKAAISFDKSNSDFLKFKSENAFWLKDYCIFMTLSELFGTKNFRLWDKDYKYRNKAVIEEIYEQHEEKIAFFEVTQFLFYKQFFELKSYANQNGIKLIGDIPFYVSYFSADVWSRPFCFKLGVDLTPVLVAGVPPDIFSKNGQLWGMPIYDWSFLKKNGYPFWRERLSVNCKLYDALRLDHFRAFSDYYAIPFGAKTAKEGSWQNGVGFHFFKELRDVLKNTEIIAEDLGDISENTARLIKKTGFKDMKVLELAFNSDKSNPFLPKNFGRKSVAYTGTHDNNTVYGWYKTAGESEKELLKRLVPDIYSSVSLNLISYALKSRAELVIIPLQDYLELDETARINTPATEKNNWCWRVRKESLNDSLAKLIKKLSKSAKR